MKLSTTTMVHRAGNAGVLLMDATFKVCTASYPVIVSGTTDARNRFRLISVSIVLGETSHSYRRVLEHISEMVSSICGSLFAPKCVLGDAFKGLTSSVRSAFNDHHPMRLVCYYHAKTAISKSLGYTSQVERRNPVAIGFLRDLDVLAASFSKRRFLYVLERLKQRYSANERINKCLTQRNWFFETDGDYTTWYWNPSNFDMSLAWFPGSNNAVESFNHIFKTDWRRKTLNL